MKDSGSSAKDLAPGQNKGAGNSAKELAPGQMKRNFTAKSDEKNYEHRSQNEPGRAGKDEGRNAKNSSDRVQRYYRSAKNDDQRDSKDRNARSEVLFRPSG